MERSNRWCLFVCLFVCFISNVCVVCICTRDAGWWLHPNRCVYMCFVAVELNLASVVQGANMQALHRDIHPSRSRMRSVVRPLM
jgi:hypothetical protein